MKSLFVAGHINGKEVRQRHVPFKKGHLEDTISERNHPRHHAWRAVMVTLKDSASKAEVFSG